MIFLSIGTNLSSENGNKIWSGDYKEAGHYYDPIYDNYVIHFLPEPQINDDW